MQEFFDYYKGAPEWVAASFATHCIHHPKGKCHKGNLCRYQHKDNAPAACAADAGGKALPKNLKGIRGGSASKCDATAPAAAAPVHKGAPAAAPESPVLSHAALPSLETTTPPSLHGGLSGQFGSNAHAAAESTIELPKSERAKEPLFGFVVYLEDDEIEDGCTHSCQIAHPPSAVAETMIQQSTSELPADLPSSGSVVYAAAHSPSNNIDATDEDLEKCLGDVISACIGVLY